MIQRPVAATGSSMLWSQKLNSKPDIAMLDHGPTEVRFCNQSQDRQGAGPRCAIAPAAARRRGDRITAQFCCTCSRQLLALSAHPTHFAPCPLHDRGNKLGGRANCPKRKDRPSQAASGLWDAAAHIHGPQVARATSATCKNSRDLAHNRRIALWTLGDFAARSLG